MGQQTIEPTQYSGEMPDTEALTIGLRLKLHLGDSSCPPSSGVQSLEAARPPQ
jgi:hypothetical protein